MPELNDGCGGSHITHTDDCYLITYGAAQGFRPPPVDTNIPVAVSVNGESPHGTHIMDTLPSHQWFIDCSLYLLGRAAMGGGNDMDTPHAKLLEVVSRNIPLPKDYKTPKPARKPPTASIKWTPDEDQRLREVSQIWLARKFPGLWLKVAVMIIEPSDCEGPRCQELA